MRQHTGVGAVLVAMLLGGALQARQALTRTEADSMQQKLAAILSRGLPAPKGKTVGTAPVRTSVTEREVNAYLRYNGQVHVPVGVVDPQVTIVGPDELAGRAFVDLDAVRKSKERTVLDPLAYVSGTMELRAAGKLHAANGVGVFQLESATLGGVTIPNALLQELVSYYSRTPEMPEGVQLDKPFELPANIRAIEIQRGAATIIQ
jgi:hypothetical protein